MIRALRLARVQPALATSLFRTAPRVAAIAVRQYSTEPVTSDLSAADAELVAALRQEHRIETETIAESDKEDGSYFSSFLESNGFEVVAKPGEEEVQLVKDNGNEKIRVFFSVSDVINSDSILDDAEEEGASGEEETAAAEESEFDDEFDSPIRLNIVVEKAKGAVGFEAVVQDDVVIVESIIPYESGALAVDESAEADYRRRQAYQGPPFSVLDPAVQSAVQQYLEVRGIDSDLALFIAEYSSFRENKEYINWLARVADILEN